MKGKCNLKDCKKYHPKMCYNALNTGKCVKKNCGYWHLKKTIRENHTSHDRNKNRIENKCPSESHNEGSCTPTEGNAFKNSSDPSHFLEMVHTMKNEMSVWQQRIMLHINTVMKQFQNNLHNHQPLLMNQGAHYSRPQWNPSQQAPHAQNVNHLRNRHGGMA